jgi:signal-transduction protein with cAMP-binding, CBS, and nucleotidyltransferase domain
MKVAEVMTQHPIAVSVNDRISRAAEAMRDLHIGLNDTGRRLQRVITARDIIVRCIAEHHPLSRHSTSRAPSASARVDMAGGRTILPIS